MELGCRVAVAVVRLHRAQLLSTPSVRPVLMQLRSLLHSQVSMLCTASFFLVCHHEACRQFHTA